MIAQKEIAKALGLSAVTVSRALRNHPDLAKETRDRIIEKARELGYPYIQNGGGKHHVIKRLGVLLYEKDPDKEYDLCWRSDSEIPRRILAGIQKEAQRYKVETIFEMPLSGEDVPLMIQNQTVSGVVIMGRYKSNVFNHLKNIPALSVSSYIDNEWLPRIVSHNIRGMQQITEYLISLGHKKILFFGAETGSTELFRERRKGYLLAMQAHGLEPAEVWGWSPDQFKAFLGQYTAIAASGDGLVPIIQEFYRDHGYVLPRDCSIVAYDGLRQSLERGITVYAPDWNLMGKTAVDLLLHHSETIQGSGIEIVIPGKLIVGTSACKYSGR